MVKFTASLNDTKQKFNRLSHQYQEKRGRVSSLGGSSQNDAPQILARPLSSLQDPKSWAPPPKHIAAHGPAAAQQSVAAANQYGQAIQPGQSTYPVQPPQGQYQLPQPGMIQDSTSSQPPAYSPTPQAPLQPQPQSQPQPYAYGSPPATYPATPPVQPGAQPGYGQPLLPRQVPQPPQSYAQPAQAYSPPQAQAYGALQAPYGQPQPQPTYTSPLSVPQGSTQTSKPVPKSNLGVSDPEKPMLPPRQLPDPKSFAPPPIVGNARPTESQIEEHLNINKLRHASGAGAGVSIRSRGPSSASKPHPDQPATAPHSNSVSTSAYQAPPPQPARAIPPPPARSSVVSPSTAPPPVITEPAEDRSSLISVTQSPEPPSRPVPHAGADFMSELSARMSGLSHQQQQQHQQHTPISSHARKDSSASALSQDSLAAVALRKKKPPPRPSSSSKPKLGLPQGVSAYAQGSGLPVPGPGHPVASTTTEPKYTTEPHLQNSLSPPPAPARANRPPMPLPNVTRSPAQASPASLPSISNKSSFSNEQLELTSLWYTAELPNLKLPAAIPKWSFNSTTAYSPDITSLTLSLRQQDLSVLRLTFEWPSQSPANVSVSETRGPPPAVLSPAQLVDYSSKFGEQVARWAEMNQGQRIGDGECWTLAQHAVRDGCGGRALAPQGYVHGALVLAQAGPTLQTTIDAMRRGDILQMTSAVFTTGSRTGEHHTAVIVYVEGPIITVIEQNVQGSPAQLGRYDLSTMCEGLAQVYRVVGVEWVEPL